MTTPTEELAKQAGGVDAHVFINTFRSGEAYILTPEELQAFREAVEAESDAERMKQPVLGYLHREQGRVMPEFHYKQSSHEGMQAVYAKPFPSTEQLQKEVDALSSKVCDQCNGDGWNYNAIEGQVPCVCMTEAEPYQQLQQQVNELAEAGTFLRNTAIAVYGCYPPNHSISKQARELNKALGAFDKALANTQGENK